MSDETKPTAEQLKERRAAWVAALRSGKYVQCQGKLSDGDGYCCLGVGCEVAIGMGCKIEKMGGLDDGPVVLYDGLTGTMPGAAMDFFGLDDGDGKYDGGYEIESLTDLNDNDTPFSEIADLIESNPAGLWQEESK